VQVCFLENLIGDGGANCDLYRGLFNLSAALAVIEHFLLLLHASGKVSQYTSLQHRLYRLSEEEAETVYVRSATASRPKILFLAYQPSILTPYSLTN